MRAPVDETLGAFMPTSAAQPAHRRANPRPQRLHTWFNLIPVKEFEDTRPDEVLFLDSFVTIQGRPDDGGPPYTVLFEGKREMTVVVELGIIFVWYGEDLQNPDRPFPRLYEETYASEYVSSRATIFEDTHVMDFVENGSDNLHFKAVHLWDYSKIYDHEVTEDTITLKQDTRFHYGSCSTRRTIRMLSKVLPELTLTQDYVYHGPGMAVVGAEGSGTPQMHALVSLTPEGANRTRVYVTMAIDPQTFPAWSERLFQRVFPQRALCDVLAGVMANFIKNEFDIDAIIWTNRKYLADPELLPSEKHLRNVIRWGESFYPKDFQRVEEPTKAPEEKRWEYLDALKNVKAGKVHRYRVAEEELIARRCDSGELHVFDAFCPHQGAHLGHGGRLDDDYLRCPFHGFYFGADGKCIGPNVDNKCKFIKTLNLTAIEHRIRDGRVEVFV
jgi:phenylpropionate dioxygenase-like ring-hydroxylating dioxygenase large terminal subunit